MNQEKIFKVLMSPRISEKATILSDKNRQFAFNVAKSANKTEIKEAVEKLFKVTVEDVTTLNIKGKVKRTRYGSGKRADVKKAYVRLAEGHDIDFTSVSE